MSDSMHRSLDAAIGRQAPAGRTEALVRREARKYGTNEPHEPTDEFVVQAFAEGARHLWPDSRDPGWHVTFRRWLANRITHERAEGAREALRNAADDAETALLDEMVKQTDLIWWLRRRADRIGGTP